MLRVGWRSTIAHAGASRSVRPEPVRLQSKVSTSVRRAKLRITLIKPRTIE